MKRILITSSDAMMYQFLLKHALNLIEQGFEVDLASFPAEGYEGQNYFERIREILPEQFSFYKIDTARSPLSPSNSKGYKQLKVDHSVRKDVDEMLCKGCYEADDAQYPDDAILCAS